MPILSKSLCSPRRQVFLGRPLFLLPCGFQSKAERAMLCSFLKVCPIHFHRLLLMLTWTGSWPVLCHKAAPVLLIVSLFQRCSILLRIIQEPRCYSGSSQPPPAHTAQFGRVCAHSTFLVWSGIWWRATYPSAFASYVVSFCHCQLKNLPSLPLPLSVVEVRWQLQYLFP